MHLDYVWGLHRSCKREILIADIYRSIIPWFVMRSMYCSFQGRQRRQMSSDLPDRLGELSWATGKLGLRISMA